MLDILEFIITWLITLTFGTFMFLIIERFLTFRFQNQIAKLITIALLASCSNIIVYPEEITGTIGFFLCFILILLLAFRDKTYLKLSIAIILFPVIAAVNYITQDIGGLIWLHVFDRNMSALASTVLHTATMALRIPFWYFVFVCVRKWISFGAKSLNWKMWLILDMISLTSFIGIISVVYKTTSYDSYTAYPTCIACIITSLGCCGLLTYMTKAAKTEMELQAYQYQQTYYKELEQNQQTVRRLRHDMKNHLNVISTFLRDRRMEQAQSYLKELNQEFATSTKIYCKNSIINAVLNAKEQLAKDSDISYQFQIDLEDVPAIEDIDLCSLLGNTLDNAIEACRVIPKITDRKMTVKARYQHHFFSYQIENTKTNEIHMKNGVIQTSKPDAEGHGIGLQNTKNIVEKYHGDMNISYNEKTFCMTVLIPL